MRLTHFLASTAFLAAAPVLACADAVEVEEEFVACLAEKDAALIAKIRDADSEEEFVAALKEGAAVCALNTEKLSMGRLFKSLNAHRKSSVETGK